MCIWEKKLCVSIPSCLNVSHEIYTSYPHLMTRKYNLSKIKSIIESVHRSNYIYIFSFVRFDADTWLAGPYLAYYLLIQYYWRHILLLREWWSKIDRTWKRLGDHEAPYPLTYFSGKKKKPKWDPPHITWRHVKFVARFYFLGEFLCPFLHFFFFPFPSPISSICR